MTKSILRIKNGNVELMNMSAQRIKIYYTKGDAIRVDWFEEDKGSVQVQSRCGNEKIIIINIESHCPDQKSQQSTVNSLQLTFLMPF